MSKFATFEELKSKRKEMVKSMKENDAFDGIKNLLTELYPDKAHFIFELLQNAEDMNASEVDFCLFNDKLIFIHNGDKRDFTLEDVEAITNISKGTKKDDPTAIGQFGVGFKAVYAYTSTPEVYSGEHCFKIVDMLVPEDEGIERQAQKGLTKFIFPFDSADKSPEKAIDEITEGLCGLDETAILFLNHIKKINYELPNGSKGYIHINEETTSIKFIYEIRVKKASEIAESISYWSKFIGRCPLMVEGRLKENVVSIAYKMKLLQDNKFEVDSNLIGKVCIFFPTDQKSDLHFHINAPFASTVARDNIRYCDENSKLIEALADLSVESLYYFRGVNLLNYSVYDALPTQRDFSNNRDSRYKLFADKIQQAFESDNLFITERGEYLRGGDVMWAGNDIKIILPSEEVETYYQKSWLPRFVPTSRTEFFIDQFKIKEFTIEDFVTSLEKKTDFFYELFVKQETEYFKRLYYLFSQAKERSGYSFYFSPLNVQKTRNEILRAVAFIKCEDGKLHKPNDGIYLKTNYQPKHYLKNPIYVEISLKNTTQDRSIGEFLLSLGVREMCEREDLVADISGDNIPVDDMIIKMMEIVKGYQFGSINIEDFANSPIFIAKKGDGKIYRVKASDCCWDNCSAFFFCNTDSVLALEEYEKAGEDIPKDLLKEIFEKLHGKLYPHIIKSNDLQYPFPLSGKIDRTGERYDTCLEQTYTIDKFDWSKLKQIKENNLNVVAQMLWHLVLKCNQEDCLYTKYQANNSRRLQRLESTLVYYLKRTAWVPTRSGEYKFPYELKEEDLLDEFKYDKPSVLLEAISVKPNDLVEQLKNSGIKDENLNKFAGLDSDVQEKVLAIAAQMQEQKRKTGKSLSEVATTSDREQLPEEDDDDLYGVFRGPKNLDKRKIKLEKEFNDREQPTTTIKKLRFVLEKPNNEEKEFVRNEYHAHCQICGNEGILTAKGKRYFEAINIFNTGELMESQQIKMDLGWNTLSLCPNCAAKFKYSQITISGLIQQAESIDVNGAQSAFFDIPIQLEGKSATIRFTPKHLLALQVAINKIKSMENEDDQ